MDEMSLFQLERSTLLATQPCTLTSETLIITSNSAFKKNSVLNLIRQIRIHSDDTTAKTKTVLLKCLA
jgi:hypothetical protein